MLREAGIARSEAERAVILGVIDSQIGVHDLLPASHDFLNLLGPHQGLARPCNDPVEPLGTFRGPRGLYGPEFRSPSKLDLHLAFEPLGFTRNEERIAGGRGYR